MDIMISQAQQNEFNDLLRDRLLKDPINFKPGKDWYAKAYEALHFLSPIKDGIKGQDLWDIFPIIETNGVLNKYQFAMANNALQNRNAVELDMEVLDFANLMILCDEYAEIWNTEVDKIKEDILEAYSPKQKGPLN